MGDAPRIILLLDVAEGTRMRICPIQGLVVVMKGSAQRFIYLGLLYNQLSQTGVEP